MVFKRSLKTAVKKYSTLFCLFVVIITTISLLLVIANNRDTVFSMTGMDIPVEITWDDQAASSRPASVILRLKDGNTEIRSLTLTAANQDPTDSDKWIGVFDGVPYSANYIISEDAVSDYSITANDLSPTLSSVTILNSATRNANQFIGSTVNVGDVNFVVWRGGINNYYYLWTLEPYSGTFSQRSCNNINADLIAAIRTLVGANNGTFDQCPSGLPMSTISYGGLGASTSISGSEGNISVAATSGLFNIGNMSAIYYGNVTPAISSTVSFENVKTITTYTLTVHHLNEDNTPFAADVVTTYNDGDTYAASPISNSRYTPELAIGSATGIITQDTEVTYVYHPNFHNVIYQFTGSVLPPNYGSLLPATVEYDTGDTVTVAQDPTATGYRFLGWSQTGNFVMPNSDVTITGSWDYFNGYFSPGIAIRIPDQKTYYRVFETVDFDITVTNNENYPITNVVVEELLSGAEFVSGTGYTIISSQEANIPTIAANSSVVLHAQYTILDDNTQQLTNSVNITAASASNYYYLDTSQNYVRTANFDVRSWQDDPVVTGVNTNSTTLYVILTLTGAVGIGASVVRIKNKRK